MSVYDFQGTSLSHMYMFYIIFDIYFTQKPVYFFINRPLEVPLASQLLEQCSSIWHTARQLSNVSSISGLQSTPSSELECQLSSR